MATEGPKIYTPADAQICELERDIDTASTLPKTESLCRLSSHEDFQTLNDLVYTVPRPKPHPLLGNAWIKENGQFRKMTLEDLKKKFAWDDEVSSERFEAMKTATISGGLIQSAITITGDERSEEVKNAFEKLKTAWLELSIRPVSASDLWYEPKKLQIIRDLVTICPDKEWKKANIDPSTFLKELSAEELASLYNGAYRMSQFVRTQGLAFVVSASMSDLIAGNQVIPSLFDPIRAGDCNMYSTLSLELFEVLRKAGTERRPNTLSAYLPLTIPGHVTLAFPLTPTPYPFGHPAPGHYLSTEIYFNNGRELLPPNYFNDADKPYDKKYLEQPQGPWTIASTYYSENVDAEINTGNGELTTRQALNLNPTDPTALQNRGTYFLKEGLHAQKNGENEKSREYLKKARNTFQTLVALNPAIAQHHLKLGIAYFELKELDLAFSSFKKASLIDPDSSATIGGLTNTLDAQEKYVESLLVLFGLKKYYHT